VAAKNQQQAGAREPFFNRGVKVKHDTLIFTPELDIVLIVNAV